MSTTVSSRKALRNQKLKTLGITVITGMLIGGLFTPVAFGMDTARLIKGLTAGFIITLTIGILELFIFTRNFKKIRFSLALVFRTLCYVAAISVSVILVWVIHESSVNNAGVIQTIKSEDFRHFIYEGDFKKILLFTVVAGFIINFFTQINSLLGKNVLFNYLTGKYHYPLNEERVFMFVDLSSSTAIAERLDPVTYHKFINNYYFDIDESIVECKGEVYQYVGDEVVISWRGSKGFENGNCIKCFFKIKSEIERLSEKYLETFGIVPEFKAGLHCGNVVTGEIGDSKREIAFHGDVLNTASRILSQCSILDKRLLVSEDVKNNIHPCKEFVFENMGKFKLKGKEKEMELFSVEELKS